MSKNLIGNSLSYTMTKILAGEVSSDDIGKIYAGTCFTEESMSKLISEYKFTWESVAHDRATAEVCQRYGVDKLGKIKDDATHEQAYLEIYARAEELTPIVTAEAERLLQNLWENNKIVQTRYRIPEGQTVVAKVKPSNRRWHQEEEYESSGDNRGEIICINGEFYDADLRTASLGIGRSGLFDSELSLIANQLYQYYVRLQFDFQKDDRLFFISKMFPQYKDALMQISETLNTNENLEENEILDLLQEALRQTGEHTAEEIGEGVRDVAQGELGEALTAITDIGEPQKDPHSLE